MMLLEPHVTFLFSFEGQPHSADILLCLEQNTEKVCGLFYNSVTISDYVQPKSWVTCNKAPEKIWKKVVMA
jgi:hypothetical protein